MTIRLRSLFLVWMLHGLLVNDSGMLWPAMPGLLTIPAGFGEAMAPFRYWPKGRLIEENKS